MGIENVIVTDFLSQYSNQFYKLNKAWIEESWVLEDSDKKDLLNPKKLFKMVVRYFLQLLITR